MTNQLAIDLAAPTPADLFAPVTSPWVRDGDRLTQPTMDHSIAKDPLTPAEKIAALLRSPLIIRASRGLVEHRIGGDSIFPEPLMLALIAGAAAYGTESALFRALEPQRRDLAPLWPVLRRVGQEAHGWRLPYRAPTRDELRGFRGRIVKAGLLDDLRWDFMVASLAMAQQMGALGQRPRTDLTDICAYNLLIGDGTISKRYSRVEEVRDPTTGEVEIFGSGATVLPPRVQRVTTDNSEDGKGHLSGVNHTHIGTLTYAGYVILGFARVTGGEGPVAMDLLDQILGQLPAGAAHAAVYDRAVIGWHAEYLLGVHALPLVGKAAASSSSSVPAHVTAARATAQKVVRQGTRARAKARGVQIKKLGPAERNHAAEQALRAAFGDHPGDQLPGLTIRTNSRGVPEVVHSAHAELGVAAHPVGGRSCEHRLVVDDNALTALDGAGRKTSHPVLQWSRARRGQHGYTVSAAWVVTCAHGDFLHREEWTPRTDRWARTDAERRQAGKEPDADRTRALSMLRLVPEPDLRWALLAGQRNITESWHNTYKQTLTRDGRARTPDVDQQTLLYLGAALAYNAGMWARHVTHQAHLAAVA